MYWAIARTEPNREHVAARFLNAAGLQVYWPRIMTRRIQRGRRITAPASLFQNYLFIHVELGWYSIRWTPGVSGLIMHADLPARLDDRIIADLRSREKHGFVVLPEPKSEFHEGDAVRIIAGPLQGSLGLYEGMRPGERVAILLGSLRATLSKDAIELAR
jgi:transcriptional antiterminator RfaH